MTTATTTTTTESRSGQARRGTGFVVVATVNEVAGTFAPLTYTGRFVQHTHEGPDDKRKGSS